MLGSKPGNYYYWYNDEYMYFSFNGLHSSRYHLFIQNSKERTIENTVGAASEYSNAMLQEGTYYLGTSRKQKTFKRKCAAEGLTRNDYKRMMKWLTVGTTGELIFDSDKYWGWTVVLDTVGDATFYGNEENLIVEFELTFKTIGTYLAHNVYSPTWIKNTSFTSDDNYNMIIDTNEYGIPSVVAMSTVDNDQTYLISFAIQNIANVMQNFDLNIIPDTDKQFDIAIKHITRVADDDKLNIPEQSNFIARFGATQFGKFMLVEYKSNIASLYVDGHIAEEDMDCLYTSQPLGLQKLTSEEPIELKFNTINTEDGKVVLTIDSEDFDILSTGDYDYVCLCYRLPNHTSYGIDKWNQDSYEQLSRSFIGFKLEDSVVDQYGAKYVCVYELDATNKQVILHLNAASIAELVNCEDPSINRMIGKLYCGRSSFIQAKIEEQNVTNKDFTIKVNSYNNL